MQKSNATIKVDTAENWEKAKNYIPDVFTIIVYTYDESSPRIKIGDGITIVDKLPFLNPSRKVENGVLSL